jgi:hypothetical protein
LNAGPMTGGKPMGNRKPQMSCLRWNSIAAATRMEFAPSQHIPGAVVTDLGRHMTEDELKQYGLSRGLNPGFVPAGKSVAEGGDFKTLEQGAAISVWCATSQQLAGMGGVYCQDVDIAPILPPDSTSNVGVRSYAIDPRAAERLWLLSERLTGVKFE